MSPRRTIKAMAVLEVYPAKRALRDFLHRMYDDYRRGEVEARADPDLSVLAMGGGFALVTIVVLLRGRRYDLGSGFELLEPPGFAAAARRLAVMRVSERLGMIVPKGAESDIT